MGSGEKAGRGERILVALGGNAIKLSHELGTTDEQFRKCNETTRILARIIAKLGKGDRLVITHGNGPQAGNLLVQQDSARRIVPPQSMDVVGAMTQGQIGYMLQQTLENNLRDVGVQAPVIALINQVQVDRNDSEFNGDVASKPVGNFLTEAEVKELKSKHPDFVFKCVKPTELKGWRRTVPSPAPIRNVESDVIRNLVDSGIVVIASGGGGIPVVRDRKGHYEGVEAVIDKDLAGERLAEAVGATVFLVLTDVDKVKLNYGRPDERAIDNLSVVEAKKYLEEGQFLPGSMGPKVQACLRFLEQGGKRAIITSLENAAKAFEGKAGTELRMGAATRVHRRIEFARSRNLVQAKPEKVRR